MAYWTDDHALDMEQRKLDAAQADARRRMDEAKLRGSGLQTQEEEYLAWRETEAWEN